jgi:ribosomal protein L32
MADVTCPSCGHQVPEGTWCVRCGHPLADAGGRRGPGAEFAAAPHERAASPRIVSTLFPRLPRADMAAFRIALAVGTAGVVALAAARLFPAAVFSAALLVPLLTVVYLYDVDVYEDEPFRVVAMTMVWGAVAGVAVALLGEAVTDTGPDLAVSGADSDVLVRAVALPLLGVALMLAGPLAVLLPYRRFNDVLDGATFGAASAVSFVAAQVVTLGVHQLDAGLRPDGDVVPWMARAVTLSVAMPVLVMAAVGSAAAAFWLRYRAPTVDRDALGPLGRPAVALLAAGALVVLGALGQPLLPVGLWLAALVVLDLVALLWLRRTIHLGLLQEAAEIPIGPAVECPNCGAGTPRHSFCIACGVALGALPKRRHDDAPPPPEGRPS